MNSFSLGLETFIYNLVLSLPCILIAFSFHEYAHARAAYALGDQTAKNMGRLTLSPLSHIDPAGLIMIIIANFGWAKPVPVNPVNFSRKVTMRRGMLLVSLAGPLANLWLSFVGAVALRFLLPFQTDEWGGLFVQMTHYFIWINLMLMIFNLIPIPPLDGSKMLISVLPDSANRAVGFLEQYGSIILILLVFTGMISTVLFPIVNGLFQFLYTYIVT